MLNPIVAKVKDLGDQKQKLEILEGDITDIATQVQEGFKMLADRTKALGREVASRPGGGEAPPPLSAENKGPSDEFLRILAVVEATRTEMHNAKTEMRMLHTEMKSLKEQKKEKERVVGPLDTSPNTAGVSSSNMALDPGAPFSFDHDVTTRMPWGQCHKRRMTI